MIEIVKWQETIKNNSILLFVAYKLKDSFFVWIGTNENQFGAMSFAMKTPFVRIWFVFDFVGFFFFFERKREMTRELDIHYYFEEQIDILLNDVWKFYLFLYFIIVFYFIKKFFKMKDPIPATTVIVDGVVDNFSSAMAQHLGENIKKKKTIMNESNKHEINKQTPQTQRNTPKT